MPIKRERMLQFSLSKGCVENTGVSFSSFLYVKPCDVNKCFISDICTYSKTGCCAVEKEYLMAVFRPMHSLMAVAPDPYIMHWLGTHILPAYHTLIKFKKRELSLNDVVFDSGKGEIKPHPIYRMINEQERAILDLWSKSGIFEIMKKSGFIKTPTLFPNIDDIVSSKNNNGDGQQGYYESMSQGDL